MRTQVWVYVAVAALSIVAGVAIAGLPSSKPRAATIQPPESTDPPAVTLATTVVVEVEPEPVVTEATTSSTTSSTTTSTTTPTTVAIVDRPELSVEVANGADVGGAATATSEALEEEGYVDVGSFDGTSIVDVTVVFAANGFQTAAERLAADLGMDEGLVFPLDTAPEVGGLPDSTELLVYLGRDVVDLPYFS